MRAYSTGRRLASSLGGGYAATVVGCLISLRAAGGERDFGRAWEQALARHPPSGTWTRTYLSDSPSPIEFLRRRCEVEWDGPGARFGLDLHQPLDAA